MIPYIILGLLCIVIFELLRGSNCESKETFSLDFSCPDAEEEFRKIFEDGAEFDLDIDKETMKVTFTKKGSK